MYNLTESVFRPDESTQPSDFQQPMAPRPNEGRKEGNKEGPGFMTMGMNLLGEIQNFDYTSVRKELEGPTAIRAICGLAGAALCVCSGLGMLNIVALIAHPPRFVLQAYECLFGLVICGIELKDAPCHNGIRDFTYKWFPALSVVGGKGAFYLFVGSLGGAFGTLNLLVFIPAMVVGACGVILILLHMGKCKELGEKYELVSASYAGTMTGYQMAA